MATQSIKINFLSHLLSFLTTKTVIEEVTTVQPQNFFINLYFYRKRQGVLT